ncbi:MAG TPA: hypothetical protein VF787_26990 [Thermoanaerobaculia bacterium]
MPASQIRLLATAVLLSVGPQLSAQSAHPSEEPSLDRPCSFVTAGQMAGVLGTPVATATDEHFRCKYVVGKGWLETKLMNLELKMTRDIYDYNRAHGRAVPGVGDQAYQLGATLAAKVGDVLVVVDGSNVPRPPDDARLKAIALRIIKAIP